MNHPSAAPRRHASGRGASAVEYALLISLIAAVVVSAVILLGDRVFDLFDVSNDSRW